MPLAGEAMPMQDVTVEEYSDGRVVLISPSAHQPDEELVIHLTTAAGLESHAARVVASSPVSVGGTLCFRLELWVEKSRSSCGENDVAEKDS
jgi:hypothetical protein